jgi:hypothetical protein
MRIFNRNPEKNKRSPDPKKKNTERNDQINTSRLNYPPTPEENWEATQALQQLEANQRAERSAAMIEAQEAVKRASQDYTDAVEWVVGNIYTTKDQPTQIGLLKSKSKQGNSQSGWKNTNKGVISAEQAFVSMLFDGLEVSPEQKLEYQYRIIDPVRKALRGVLLVNIEDSHQAGMTMLDSLNIIDQDKLYFWNQETDELRVINFRKLKLAFSSHLSQGSKYTWNWIWQQFDQYLGIPIQVSQARRDSAIHLAEVEKQNQELR